MLVVKIPYYVGSNPNLWDGDYNYDSSSIKFQITNVTRPICAAAFLGFKEDL